MKIIHYMMGLPPVRGGGLVRYVLDLASAQINMGHEIILLIPGKYDKTISGVKIISGKWNHFDCGVIINPLPVTMGRHLSETSLLCERGDKQTFTLFLREQQPDVIHIHSFMGLHREFLQAAKELNIGILYTTHDYYGLCPGITLFSQRRCCEEREWKKCADCIGKTISFRDVVREQSDFYAGLKSNHIYHWAEYAPSMRLVKQSIRSLSNGLRTKISKSGERSDLETERIHQAEEYEKLRMYYRSMFEYVDYFLFNSSQSEEIYRQKLGDIQGKCILVTNRDIFDRRELRVYAERGTLKIGYMGSGQYYKGFPILLRAIKQINKEDESAIECHVFFNYYGKENYIKQHHPYPHSRLKETFSQFDLVVVPSVWKETYGMVVTEALSLGVPVIITDHVGAKDILTDQAGCGILTKPTVEGIKEALVSILNDRNRLNEMNRNICSAQMDFSYHNHVKAVTEAAASIVRRN